MKYDEYLAAGYPIGSGVVEGACRHLVKDRMEQTGMRWRIEGAQAILNLRAIYVNDDDVAGEDEITGRAGLGPSKQDAKPPVRNSRSVQVESMAEEPPCLLGVGFKPNGIRDFFECSAAKRRIRLPKPLVAAKIRQAGIDSHPGAGSYHKRVRLRHRLGGSVDLNVNVAARACSS